VSKSAPVSTGSVQNIDQLYIWRETIEFRKELMEMVDDLAADGQQFTAEMMEEMHGNDGEDDWKIREGNYTKVDVTIYVLGICDQRKD